MMADHLISYLAAIAAGVWSAPLLAMLLFARTTPKESRGHTYRYVAFWGLFLFALVSMVHRCFEPVRPDGIARDRCHSRDMDEQGSLRSRTVEKTKLAGLITSPASSFM